MQIRAGSLLIANPRYAHPEHEQSVVFITESTEQSTMGIVLNSRESYDLASILENKGVAWPYQTLIGQGGEYSPTCLMMVHTNEWYSSNTMPITNRHSISSDEFMLEKVSAGNEPIWWRLFMGVKGWTPLELNQELKSEQPKWLLLARPPLKVLHSESKQMWTLAVNAYSQDMFSSYI